MKKLIDNRPWGNFVEYTHNENTTVKILTVLPHQELSLQRHLQRQEFWKILKGHPHLIIGHEKVETKPGDEFEIQIGVEHQIQAIDDEVQVLELSFGEFSEEDIIRIKDKYGRA